MKAAIVSILLFILLQFLTATLLPNLAPIWQTSIAAVVTGIVVGFLASNKSTARLVTNSRPTEGQTIVWY